MAGSNLFTLIDDIATLLDDLAIMTKVAAKKTAGVLGDDLALNAQQVTGVNADRELPVVWAVAIGSLKNKLILVPAALVISAFAPWAVIPLLMFGGVFLCYEGFEKLAHKFLHSEDEDKSHESHLKEAVADSAVDMVAFEKEKISGAIRTDFILSAEIIAITLGTVATAAFTKQVIVLTGIAFIMTIGVYGIVAGIVKLDDLGLYLNQKTGDNALVKAQRSIGSLVLSAAPYLMKGLSIVGTAAMFMVGGGILTHGLPGAHDVIHGVAHKTSVVPLIGGLMESATPTFLDAMTGILAGAVALAVMTVVGRMWSAMKSKPA
jgi:predicted DNA repair protein MutK